MIAFLFASSCSQSFFNRMVHNSQRLQYLHHDVQEAIKKMLSSCSFMHKIVGRDKVMHYCKRAANLLQ